MCRYLYHNKISKFANNSLKSEDRQGQTLNMIRLCLKDINFKMIMKNSNISEGFFNSLEKKSIEEFGYRHFIGEAKGGFTKIDADKLAKVKGQGQLTDLERLKIDILESIK